MRFGTKAGKDVKDDIKRSSGGGQYLWNVQDGKDMRVRFLEEPEEWTKFREHYSNSTKFFPCSGEDDCKGCTSDDERLSKSSRRYAAHVLDVKNGKVIPLKMPVDLADRVYNKYTRNDNTILNRDYTLIRDGKDLDTKYDVENEDRSQIDISRYRPQFQNIEEILAKRYNEVWGDGSIAEPPQHKQVKPEDDPPPF